MSSVANVLGMKVRQKVQLALSHHGAVRTRRKTSCVSERLGWGTRPGARARFLHRRGTCSTSCCSRTARPNCDACVARARLRPSGSVSGPRGAGLWVGAFTPSDGSLATVSPPARPGYVGGSGRLVIELATAPGNDRVKNHNQSERFYSKHICN